MTPLANAAPAPRPLDSQSFPKISSHTNVARHPLGSRARVLLTGVFGPYARDDEYGSRAINRMELYHNQVTRVQGVFSVRMFHRSWGQVLIQENIGAPCTLLDFPTRDRFIRELQSGHFDIVGISAIRSITPLDLEQQWGLTEGDLNHGQLILDQLFFMRPMPGWSDHRTAVDGLYLCGSGMHGGGGISGAAGRNAARRLLR